MPYASYVPSEVVNNHRLIQLPRQRHISPNRKYQLGYYNATGAAKEREMDAKKVS